MATKNNWTAKVVKSGNIFSDIFGVSRILSLAACTFILGVMVLATWWFVHSAPARKIVLATGPEGSTFARNAEKYRPVVEGKAGDPAHPVTGVKLEVVPSLGSQDNLARLKDRASRVDVGFVLSKVQPLQSAAPKSPDAPDGLVSLGCVAYQPLFIFYRADTPLRLLSDFSGKRLSIGAPGGGANALATTLLEANGVTPKTATITTEPSSEAAKALLAGSTDAVFLMGESAPVDVLKTLLRTPGIKLFSFAQADAYVRKFSGLNKLKLPEGGIEIGRNIPAQDVWLIGPTVQLVAREKLDAPLSDLLLDAAREAHGNASLLQNKGEFPAPIEQDFAIGDAAARYYKNGKSLFYRHLPFWMATVADQVVVVFLPTLLVLFSGLRLIHGSYKSAIQFRINRWYRILHKLERERFVGLDGGKRQQLLDQLESVGRAVQHMRVPAGFVSQLYGLRQHVEYVRGILLADGGELPASAHAA